MKTISVETARVCQAALNQVERDTAKHLERAKSLGHQDTVPNWERLLQRIRQAAAEVARA